MVLSSLENLPSKTVHQIASLLEHKDIMSLSLTCHSLRSKLYGVVWSRFFIHGGDQDLARKLELSDPESEDDRATPALVKYTTSSLFRHILA